MKSMLLMSQVDSGFSLVELLLTVTIVGVLVSIAIPEFTEYRKRAYDTISQQTVKDLVIASQAYRIDSAALVNCDTVGGTFSGIDCSSVFPGFTSNGDITCLMTLRIDNGTRVDQIVTGCIHSKGSKVYGFGGGNYETGTADVGFGECTCSSFPCTIDDVDECIY